MRPQMENTRAVGDLSQHFMPVVNGAVRSGGNSFENIFMTTSNVQAERPAPRQQTQSSGVQRQSAQNERQTQTQAAEQHGRPESVDPARSRQVRQGSEQTSGEAAAAQNSERTVYDSVEISSQAAEVSSVSMVYVLDEQDLQNQLMTELAELLGLDLAALELIMQQLSFTPEDLVEPANRTMLLQAVFGLESEVQLLNIPDAVQIHQQIAELLTKHNEMTYASQASQPSTAHAQAQVVSETLPQAPVLPQQVVELEPVAQDQPIEELQRDSTPRPEFGANLSQEKQDTQDGQLSHTAQQKPAEEPRLEVVQQSDGTFVVTESSTNQAARIVSVSSRPAPQSINAQDIIRQLADNMRFDIRGSNVSEIRMTLRPENLGEVTMRIAAENGIVTASFVAENSRVKETIEANMNQLRQALEEKGLEVSQLSVSVETNADERMRQFLAEQARSSGRLREITQGLEGEGEALEGDDARLPHLDSTVEFRA